MPAATLVSPRSQFSGELGQIFAAGKVMNPSPSSTMVKGLRISRAAVARRAADDSSALAVATDASIAAPNAAAENPKRPRDRKRPQLHRDREGAGLVDMNWDSNAIAMVPFPRAKAPAAASALLVVV